MDEVFIDATAWIAILNTKDQRHAQAQKVMHQLRQQKRPLITSEFVLLELADGLSTRNFRHLVVPFINNLRMSEIIKVIPISQDLLLQGWDFYMRRPDKEWGLTDCTSFVIMHNEGITTAFTSDRHFIQAEFQILLT